jgi:hypothetical protein
MGLCQEIYQEGVRIPSEIDAAGRDECRCLAMLLNSVRTLQERGATGGTDRGVSYGAERLRKSACAME